MQENSSEDDSDLFRILFRVGLSVDKNDPGNGLRKLPLEEYAQKIEEYNNFRDNANDFLIDLQEEYLNIMPEFFGLKVRPKRIFMKFAGGMDCYIPDKREIHLEKELFYPKFARKGVLNGKTYEQMLVNHACALIHEMGHYLHHMVNPELINYYYFFNSDYPTQLRKNVDELVANISALEFVKKFNNSYFEFPYTLSPIRTLPSAGKLYQEYGFNDPKVFQELVMAEQYNPHSKKLDAVRIIDTKTHQKGFVENIELMDSKVNLTSPKQSLKMS